jgi:small subunit ribosomal protein S8
MSLNDPIADMLTRIRNANSVKRATVMVRQTKICKLIADVLKAEGYITGYEEVADGPKRFLKVTLRYGPRGEQLIRDIKRESKVGCRLYKGVGEIPRPLAGMGISIVSTSRGVLSDRQCREMNVGGELLCTIS